MTPRFSVFFPGSRADLSDSRTDRSRDNLGNPQLALSGSVYQLEQLVSEQGNQANHEVKPHFCGSPDHDVLAAELFFQAAVEALGHGPFPVTHCLMRSQGDRVFPAAVLLDDGDVPRLRLIFISGMATWLSWREGE